MKTQKPPNAAMATTIWSVLSIFCMFQPFVSEMQPEIARCTMSAYKLPAMKNLSCFKECTFLIGIKENCYSVELLKLAAGLSSEYSLL